MVDDADLPDLESPEMTDRDIDDFDTGGEDEDVPDKTESFQDEASDRERISSLATSMRVVEDRYGTLRKKLQLTDNELIEAQQEFERERKVLSEDIMAAKERIEELEERVATMEEEIQQAVHERDFRYLKKYVEYWDPSRFVSRSEAEKMIGDRADVKNE